MATSATIGFGSTPPGSTDWKLYQDKPGALFVEVDTTGSGFTSTPTYFTSLGGLNQHWDLVGMSSVYSPTATGFRVYIKTPTGAAKDWFTVENANKRGWHVNWFGIAAG